MAIPTSPTVTTVVTEGLKRGGRVSPTTSQITDATNYQFQEVKADIYLKAPRHFTLLTTKAQATTLGVSRYNWPTNCEQVRSVQLVDSPTTGFYNSTAQGGGANTITLNASFTEQTANMQGRMIFITTGTGAGQYGQITNYNDSTKVATIEANWATLDSTWVSPDSTSGYLVEAIRYKLWDIDKPVEWDTIPIPFQQGTPSRSVMVGRQTWLDLAPDRVYMLVWDYWYALDQLDETSTLFTNHLRKFQSLWTQGIATKVCQRFDEDRYSTEINIYNTMLDLYGASSSSVGQVKFRDIG